MKSGQTRGQTVGSQLGSGHVRRRQLGVQLR